ncbi:hypothetical protein B0H13DRAFT_1853799 [Mycena leptocephala]|nr:hypothetical protein B0H13DRAFT_1853799 [Mycena leptocephala]
MRLTAFNKSAAPAIRRAYLKLIALLAQYRLPSARFECLHNLRTVTASLMYLLVFADPMRGAWTRTSLLLLLIRDWKFVYTKSENERYSTLTGSRRTENRTRTLPNCTEHTSVLFVGNRMPGGRNKTKRHISATDTPKEIAARRILTKDRHDTNISG